MSTTKRRGPPVIRHKNLEHVMATLRTRCKRLSQAEVARRAGVPAQHVSNAIHGLRVPAGKLLAWLGYEVAFVRIRARPAEPIAPVAPGAQAADSAPAVGAGV